MIKKVFFFIIIIVTTEKRVKLSCPPAGNNFSNIS